MDASGDIDMEGWTENRQPVTLYSGWNLIGFNGDDLSEITTDLPGTGISGKWKIIWGWIDGEWYAKGSDLSMLLGVEPLKFLYQGRGYWIFMNEDGVWAQ